MDAMKEDKEREAATFFADSSSANLSNEGGKRKAVVLSSKNSSASLQTEISSKDSGNYLSGSSSDEEPRRCMFWAHIRMGY